MSELVLVLSGGLSHERDVSLRSGRRIATALADHGHTVVESDIDSELVALLRRNPDAVVFPLLHGETGEDGAIREVFDLIGVPYVGSRGPACRLAFDKSIATPVMREAGMRTPAQIALPHEIFRELGASSLVQALGANLGFPLMVKPSRSGSALGCTKVESAEELPGAMVGAYAYGPVAVVEEFVEGTEVAVAVLDTGAGPQALPAVEIRPESGVYDYSARYTAGATRFLCPAELDESTSRACAELALSVHRELGLRDLSRTDMIIDRGGEPFFLETNVSPGMTETSLVPLAMESAGHRLGEVCAQLVSNSRARATRGGDDGAIRPDPDPRTRDR